MTKNNWKLEVLAFIFMCIFVPIGYIIFVIQQFIEFLKTIFDMYEFKDSLYRTGDSITEIRYKIYKYRHSKTNNNL